MKALDYQTSLCSKQSWKDVQTFQRRTIGGTGLRSPGPRTGKLALPSQVVSGRRRQGSGGSQEREEPEEREQASSFCSLEFFTPD